MNIGGNKMKTACKSLLALGMALSMLFALTACDDGGLSKEDASKCIQVEMDTTYKGEFDGFLDYYSNMTKSDALDQYTNNLTGEVSNFLYMFGLDDPNGVEAYLSPSDGLVSRAEELYKEIYAKSSYEVQPATKQDDGTYAVKVVVQPIDILHQVYEASETYFADFFARYEEVDTDSMSEEEAMDWFVNTYAEDYYATLIDLLESKVPTIGYLDDKSIVIQVDMDDEYNVLVTDEDWMTLDKLIIDRNF